MLNWSAAIFERAAYEDLAPTRQIRRLQSVIQLFLTGYASPGGILMENTCWCLTSWTEQLVRLRGPGRDIVTTIVSLISTCVGQINSCVGFLCVGVAQWFTFPFCALALALRSDYTVFKGSLVGAKFSKSFQAFLIGQISRNSIEFRNLLYLR